MAEGPALPRAARKMLLAACAALAVASPGGCGAGAERDGDPPDFEALRERMVREQIEARGISDARVLAALRAVPRHRFVPESQLAYAYRDGPLPIGHGQTISQPYIVASMTELVDPQPGDTVLEIGTGSGYQAAVLARLVRHVYSVELLEPLARSARERLRTLGVANVTVIHGDGYLGLPAQAPFDGIVVTAAPEKVPAPLLEQLAVGAKLVIPVGGLHQELRLLERTPQGITERGLYPVRFVPLVPGPAQRGR